MASIYDNLGVGKHGCLETTLMESTTSGGHFYNVVADVDLDRGSVALLKPENYAENDSFKVVAPAVTDKVILIDPVVKIYQEYEKRMQEEENYFLGKGEIGRGREIKETDRFALDVNAFKADTDLTQKYVVVDGAGFKLTTVATEPDETHGFVGYIYGTTTNGKYKIFVKRNRPVE